MIEIDGFDSDSKHDYEETIARLRSRLARTIAASGPTPSHTPK